MTQLRMFLSHSSQDKAFADALVHGLLEAGADVWYDAHNLGAGQLLDDIQRELRERPVFVVVLSKAACASPWVGRECKWAYNLYCREPNRIMLPVVAQAIEPSDFNSKLFLEGFKRIEANGGAPLPQAEAIAKTLHALGLTPGDVAQAAFAPKHSRRRDGASAQWVPEPLFPVHTPRQLSLPDGNE